MIHPSLLRQTLLLALPVALQQCLIAAQGATDVIMISHLDDTSVAAVGLGSRVHFMLQLVMSAVAIGGATFVAQFAGNGRQDAIRSTLLRTLLLGSGFALLLQIPLQIHPQWITAMATDDPLIRELSRRYIVVVAWSMLATQSIVILEFALRAQQQTLLPTLMSTLSVLLNVILNYGLIFGALGMPALGVEGAAWATTISRCLHLATLVLLLVCLRSPSLPKHVREIPALLKSTHGAWVGQLVSICAPVVISIGLWSLGNLMYHLIAGRMGTQALAVASLMAPVESLATSIFVGLFSACGVLLGHRLGRNEFDAAQALAVQFLKFSVLLAILLGAVLALSRSVLINSLGNMDASTLTLFHSTLGVLCAALWLRVATMILINGVLRSGGDNRFCMVLDCVCMWCIELPLAAILAFHLQYPYYWVFGAFVAGEAVKLVIALTRVQGRVWMRNLT